MGQVGGFSLVYDVKLPFFFSQKKESAFPSRISGILLEGTEINFEKMD